MKTQKPSYIPQPDMSKEEMKQMQREIAEEAVFKDKTDFNLENSIVVGIDQAFTDENSVSCAVAMKNGEIIETVSASEKTTLPYIPGLLAFREGGSIVKALEKLEIDPDLLMLDGSGRIHFRQAGIATHIGVIFDKPSIGVAKNLLCGKVELPEKMQKGEKRKILSDNSVENLDTKETIGYAYQSKQYASPKRSINPPYVSPGHKINAKTSVEIVSKYCHSYKLPKPIQVADTKVSEIKNQHA